MIPKDTTDTAVDLPRLVRLPWADDDRLTGPPYCGHCGKICVADDCTYVGGHCDGYYHQSCWDAKKNELPDVLKVIAKYAVGEKPNDKLCDPAP